MKPFSPPLGLVLGLLLLFLIVEGLVGGVASSAATAADPADAVPRLVLEAGGHQAIIRTLFSPPTEKNWSRSATTRRSARSRFQGYQGHGVFTYVLLEGLRHADATFGNRDGYTGLFELAAYVNDQVPTITMNAFNFEQIPQVNMVGADFPIGVVTATES